MEYNLEKTSSQLLSALPHASQNVKGHFVSRIKVDVMCDVRYEFACWFVIIQKVKSLSE